MEKILYFYPEVKDNQKRTTVAGVVDTESNTLRIGTSACSVKDKFRKDKGRAIALGRAKSNRPFQVKQFMQKGQVAGDNSILRPWEIQLADDRSSTEQFMEIAKNL